MEEIERTAGGERASNFPRILADEIPKDQDLFEKEDDWRSVPRLPLELHLVDVFERLDDRRTLIIPGTFIIEIPAPPKTEPIHRRDPFFDFGLYANPIP